MMDRLLMFVEALLIMRLHIRRELVFNVVLRYTMRMLKVHIYCMLMGHVMGLLDDVFLVNRLLVLVSSVVVFWILMLKQGLSIVL